ncbi:hypothetical protein GCM10009720_10290 [Yaniella flava]|uniref:Asparagine synthase n=1 Tax=Yaniella flava TaxID=287930 RepID=A0ABN2UB66_9MICC|nr:hypothetical protein [Micrococcaceae bacterium]
MVTPTWTRLYARGFFLSSEPVAIFEELAHYRWYDLAGDVLFADEITEVGIAYKGDDWLVTIGKLLPLSTGAIDPRAATIADDLLELFQRDGFTGTERALYDIGGRHAVLLKSKGRIIAYNDAAGHRTVYFNQAQQRIASHFDMLQLLTSTPTSSCPFDSERPATSPDGLWDVTGNPDIKALLPNHRLHLHDGSQPRFGLMNPNPYKNVDWAEKVETIHQLWDEQLQQLFAMAPQHRLGISLSGGLDSRTVLAHMRPYLDNVTAFTYTASNVKTGKTPTSFWQRTMVTDHNVLMQLADHLPKDFHVLVKPRTPNLTADDIAVMERNAMRNHGQPMVRMYKDIFPNVNSIHVRGNFVEMGRLIRGQLDIPGRKDRLAPVLSEVVRRRKPDVEAFAPFFWNKVDQFQYDLLHDDVEYTDTYHWENRSSRWYAEIANETDMVFDSIVPVNARRIYEILLSPRRDVRPGAQLQVDLIHRAWPELLAYGFNDEKDRYTTTVRKQLLEQQA